jgi:hypothetical protein
LVTVTQPTQQTWATAADVLALTGQQVDDTTVATANSVVEILGDRIYTIAAARTGSRDLELMRRAVVFEAVWITGQPDFFTRMDVNAITEGRRSIGVKDLSLMLAPMAKMALRRVSWLRSRSLHTRSPWIDGRGGALSPNPDAEVNDALEAWAPMGGG